MIYLQLFLSFLQVGLFSIGGGYAAMPLIKDQVVDAHQWISLQEYVDLITIAEMTPGPMAINSATFVGIRIAGIGGAIIASLAVILPSCIILSFLYYIYCKYQQGTAMQSVLASLRPAVVALIASAALMILQSVVFQGKAIATINVDWLGVSLFVVALVVLRKWKLSPILIMVLCGVITLGLYVLFGIG